MPIHPNVEGRKVESDFFTSFYHPFFQIFLFSFKKCVIKVNPSVISDFLLGKFNGNIFAVSEEKYYHSHLQLFFFDPLDNTFSRVSLENMVYCPNIMIIC